VSPGEYVAAAYGVVLVALLAYVAIIAAKLVRIQRQVTELLDLAGRRPIDDVSSRHDAPPAAGTPAPAGRTDGIRADPPARNA
jgi:hypothetical protein